MEALTYAKYTDLESKLRNIIAKSQVESVPILEPYFDAETDGSYGVVYRVSEVPDGQPMQEKEVVEDRTVALIRTCQRMQSLYSCEFYGADSLDRAADARLWLGSMDGQRALQQAGIALLDTRELRDLFDLLPDQDTWERRALFDFSFVWVHAQPPSRAARRGIVRRVCFDVSVDDAATENNLVAHGPIYVRARDMIFRTSTEFTDLELYMGLAAGRPETRLASVGVRPLSFQTLLLIHGYPS